MIEQELGDQPIGDNRSTYPPIPEIRVDLRQNLLAEEAVKPR
jgi:hypothetical protein